MAVGTALPQSMPPPSADGGGAGGVGVSGSLSSSSTPAAPTPPIAPTGAAAASLAAPAPADPSECVRVVVRCRPLSAQEHDEGRERVVEVDESGGAITLHAQRRHAGEPPKCFAFDHVYSAGASQVTIHVHQRVRIREWASVMSIRNEHP